MSCAVSWRQQHPMTVPLFDCLQDFLKARGIVVDNTTVIQQAAVTGLSDSSSECRGTLTPRYWRGCGVWPPRLEAPCSCFVLPVGPSLAFSGGCLQGCQGDSPNLAAVTSAEMWTGRLLKPMSVLQCCCRCWWCSRCPGPCGAGCRHQRPQQVGGTLLLGKQGASSFLAAHPAHTVLVLHAPAHLQL